MNERLAQTAWLAGLAALGLLGYRLLFVAARRLAIETGGRVCRG